MANKFLRDLTQCSALAIATGLVLSGGKAQAQSFAATGTVAEGAATITTGVGTTDITVQTPSAVIDWAPDDIQGVGDILFQQAGTTATFTNGAEITDFAVLNRILPTDSARRIVFDGNVVSRIQDAMGTRTGGTVFFYTPGGIVIGANATFDVGNLGLTTAAPLTDGMGNFIVNNQVRFQQSLSNASISIDPGAQINALAEGSYVALFAPRITQGGAINVNGQAALVGAEAGTITFSPDGLFDIEVEIGSDSGVPIEHYGSTGGPASSGAGDNHRIYLVSVSKNTAATLAIRGGSRLGFDIAQSASMDGEAIVLSAGYSITVGDIGPEAPGLGENYLNIEDFDYGFGPGLEFTSDVFAAATGDVYLGVGNDTVFHGDARLEGGYVSANIFDQGMGILGLQVGGNLSLIANRPRFGTDVSQAFFSVGDGSSALIGGNLLVASNAAIDFDGNGEITSGHAGLNVSGAGATLTVGGNVHVNADIDISGDRNGLAGRAGSADLSANNGGAITVGGVTRMTANARAGTGGDAFAGFTNIGVHQGGQFTTGELAFSVDARGGDSAIGNGGNAFAGSAQINIYGAGSAFEVLGGNTIGDAAAGELQFMSSEAIGGASLVGNGGNANGGSLNIYVSDQAQFILPNQVGNALQIVSAAIGGDTSADNAFAGSATAGHDFFYAFNTVANFGRLAYFSSVQGGSVLGAAIGSTGGDASGGHGSFQFTDSDVTIAFDPFAFSMIGGAGSADGSGVHGSTFANDFNISAQRGTLTIADGLSVLSSGVNGDGSAGESRGFFLSIYGTEAQVNGDIAIDASYVGMQVGADFETGLAGSLTATGDVLLQSTGPRFGSDNGGAYLTVSQGSRLDVLGDLSLIARALSDADGDLIARSSGASINVYDPGSVIAVGGNLLLDAGIDLRGDDSGLGAQGGFAQVYAFGGGLVDVAGVSRLVTDAFGGTGADAFAGYADVSIQQGGQFVTGELAISSDARGGDSEIGIGGNAIAGSANINVSGAGSSFAVLRSNTTGDAFLSSEAVGGTSLVGNGGDAFGGSVYIYLQDQADFALPDELGNPLQIVSTAIGGDTFADNASAGSAFGGQDYFYAFNTAANFGRLAFLSTLQGGSVLGGAIGSSGGDATGGHGSFQFTDADVIVAFDPIISHMIGGAGSADGSGVHGITSANDFNIRAQRGTLTIADGLSVLSSGVNGDGSAGESRGFYLSLYGTEAHVNGDIAIDASYVGLQVGADFETGLAGSLTVSGNVLLQATGPRFGSDSGGAYLDVSQGSRLDVLGDLSLIARATTDADGDLIARSSNVSINARDAGSVISVGGNLLLDAGIDLRGDDSGFGAHGGSAQVYATDAGLIDIAGLTRIVTDAYAGGGAEARAGFALASAYRGGQLRTGELSISADAHGGADIGSGGGVAFGGNASLEAYDPGSSLTVLSASQGGKLALLSSQAFGGTGIGGDGGAATAGYAGISLHAGASLALPADPLNPLVLRATARGGDTHASDAIGGHAQAGSIAINVYDSTANLGRMRIESTGIGGSALALAERTRGGDAANGQVRFYAQNASVTAAFDQILLSLQGGDGSSDGLGDGGSAFGGSINISTFRSALDILGDLNASGVAIGGTGGNGGFARGVRGSSRFEESQVSIAGDFSFVSQARGGLATATGFGTGGGAENAYLSLGVHKSTLEVTGDITLATSGRGGDAGTGQGGQVHGSQAAIFLDDGTVISAASLNASSTGIGGSILPGGIGNGGSAYVGGATISLDRTFDPALGVFLPESHAAITGDVTLTSTATGGNAGALGGDGGEASSGTTAVYATNAGSLTFGGNVTMDSRGQGGDALAGTGGAGFGGSAEIYNYGFVDTNSSELFDGGDVAVTGNVTLGSAALGGAGLVGGHASGGYIGINSRMTETSIGGTLTLLGTALGGDGLSGGVGGHASGGFFAVDAYGLETDPQATGITLGNLAVQLVAQGGKGGDGSGAGDGGRGGDAQGFGGFVFGRASKGTLTVTGSTAIDFATTGGEGGAGANGGAGGHANGGSLQFGTASGGATPGAINGSANFTDVAITMTNRGGKGGDATTGTGGLGGTGQGGFVGLLARGAPINANTVSVAVEGIGGNGGAGAAAGDGGDGVGGSLSFLVSQAFQNEGRGTTTIGSLQMLSQGIGGSGANPGQGLYGAGGTFRVSQADVAIDTLDIAVIGAGPASAPFAFTLFNATLVSNAITGNFAGNVQLDVIDSLLASNIFDFEAAGFVLPALDPNAPEPVQGVIDASQSLRLVSREGDVATRAQLSSAQIAIHSAGSVTLGDVSGPIIDIVGGSGSISFASLDGGAVALQSDGTIALGAVTADSLAASTGFGDIVASQPLTLSGALTLDAGGAITIADVSAGHLSARSQSGGIALDGAVNVGSGILLDSALGISAGPITAGSLSAAANGGTIALNGPVSIAGATALDSARAIALGDMTTGSLTAIARDGDIIAGGTITATDQVSVEAAGSVELANISAASLDVRSGGVTRIAGEWQGGAIDITTAQLEITEQGLVAGAEGVFSLHSLNQDGILFTQTDPGDFAGLVIDGAMFDKLQVGTIHIASALAEGGNAITIGDFDLAGNSAFKVLNFATGSTGTIHVAGNVTVGEARDPIALAFATDRFTLDSASASIDLLANKGAITIAADRILVGEGAVLDALTGEETQKQLADLFNKAATVTREKGVLGASQLTLAAGSELLVQNTGTADARAGISVGSADGLVLGNGETSLFFILNGKLTDAAGKVLAGRDAAKAFLAGLTGTEALAPKSMFNGCELSGCPQVVSKSGEITATVSAAVSGATNTGSGAGTTGTSGGSKNGGSQSGGSSDESGGEEPAASSSGGAGATGTGGSSAGGEVTADNVDDGGGGDEEFAIEEDDSGGDGASESEEAESSDDEESSEEEQGSEEEDEDSDGPVSGPIMPPPSLINTNSLETRGPINDPISGSGNPALIDPDVDAPLNSPTGGQ